MNNIIQEMQYRVLYADTDAMGVMYYANYLRVYEAARGDFMRKIGFSFGQMESHGVVCPAINVNIEYIKYVRFDSLVRVVSTISKFPEAKLEFIQEMYDEDNYLVNRAVIILGFVNTEKNRATRCPKWLADIFNQF